jgi:hypothetical protein
VTAGARLTGSVALLVGFASGVTTFGFYAALIVYLAAHMAYLGVRPYALVAAVAVGMAAVFYALFDIALAVPVPRGSFWN